MLTRRWSSKAIWMRSGCSSGSICWVLLVSGRFPFSKTIIPDAKEHFLTPSPRRDAHPFGGLGLSVGELVALVRGVARLGQEEYNQLQQEIRASPVVYGDETGWREDGRNGYLWSFSNPEVRYFLRRGSRGSKVVAEVLGDEFDGVLVSDFYGAYNVHQGLHQRCWTHLLRDIHQLKEKYPQHQGLAQWAQQVREVYDHAQAGPGPDPELPERCSGPSG